MLSLDFLVSEILLSSEVAPNAHQLGASNLVLSWLFAVAASLSSRANDRS